MDLKEGYIYRLSEEYFNVAGQMVDAAIVKDETWKGAIKNFRPFVCIFSPHDGFYWMVPMSSQSDKDRYCYIDGKVNANNFLSKFSIQDNVGMLSEQMPSKTGFQTFVIHGAIPVLPDYAFNYIQKGPIFIQDKVLLEKIKENTLKVINCHHTDMKFMPKFSDQRPAKLILLKLRKKTLENSIHSLNKKANKFSHIGDVQKVVELQRILQSKLEVQLKLDSAISVEKYRLDKIGLLYEKAYAAKDALDKIGFSKAEADLRAAVFNELLKATNNVSAGINEFNQYSRKEKEKIERQIEEQRKSALLPKERILDSAKESGQPEPTLDAAKKIIKEKKERNPSKSADKDVASKINESGLPESALDAIKKIIKEKKERNPSKSADKDVVSKINESGLPEPALDATKKITKEKKGSSAAKNVDKDVTPKTKESGLPESAVIAAKKIIKEKKERGPSKSADKDIASKIKTKAKSRQK